MTLNTQLDGDELYKRQANNRKTDAPIIICDGLKTPDNLGSILRAADAAGSNEIILLDSQIDLNNHKITKLSRSTDKTIHLKKMTLAEFLCLRHNFNNLFALEITRSSENIFDSDISPCDAIIIGHESTGIREEVLALCDNTFHLPMFGINGSMNVSHALIVFLYEWRHQTNI